MKSSFDDQGLYRWKQALQREGLTATLRLELRELLAPKVFLKKPFRSRSDDSNTSQEHTRLNQLVNWELKLAADRVYSTLKDSVDEHWTSALPFMLNDFQQLLHDVLDLLRELEEADDRNDPSHWNLPSITPHWQNRESRNWVSLIELLRDAWLEVHVNDRVRATRIAQSWFELPYPTFKRLALFAASQDECISANQWVDWLLSDGLWFLWSETTKREVCRLFVLQGHHLTKDSQQRLEEAILVGPPREMYRDDLEPDQWQNLVIRSTWLHLAKLNESGLDLGSLAAIHFGAISTANPELQLATNQRDEFSQWISSTGDPDFDDNRKVTIAPRKRLKLKQWLTEPTPQVWPFYEDTWQNVCRTRFFHSLLALRDLACEEVWPIKRWREAIYEWTEEGMVLRSWKYAAALVSKIPNAELQEINQAVSGWIEAASISINRDDRYIVNLCRRLLFLPLKASSISQIDQNDIEAYDPVDSALNHSIGHVTQALINIWLKQKPNDNDLLPPDLKIIFTELCNVQIEHFRNARVVLGCHVITFFRVDPSWTKQHLLPFFSWDNLIEAKAVWEGFLSSMRVYSPLMVALKWQLLESPKHYNTLGKHKRQLAALLTHLALGKIESYTTAELQSAISAFPQDGLEESALTLSYAIESAGDQGANFWKNRAQPFWQEMWPKFINRATSHISNSLTHVVIAAQEEFPSALATVHGWLLPIEYPNYVIQLLHKSNLCARYPENALKLLSAVIVAPHWIPHELKQCLEDMVQAAPQLASDNRYMRLHNYVRKI